MTTIKEVLKTYYPSKENNPGYPEAWWLGELGKSSRAKIMRHDFKAKQNLYILDKFCSAYKINYYPDDVVYLMDQINIKTIEEFSVWLDCMNKHDPHFFVDTLTGTGKIDVPLFPISDQEIFGLMIKNFPGFSNVEYKDSKYQISTKVGLQEIMQLSPAKQYSYSQNSLDCDDYVRILRGWLSKNDLGNFVMADCEIDCYFQGKHKYSHNICLSLIKETNGYQFMFCEPQTTQIWKVTDSYPDISIDKVKLRKVIF